MRTDSSDQQNPSEKQKASGTRGGVVVDDVSKGVDSDGESETTGSKGSVVGDDKSKNFGGPDDNMKG